MPSRRYCLICVSDMFWMHLGHVSLNFKASDSKSLCTKYATIPKYLSRWSIGAKIEHCLIIKVYNDIWPGSCNSGMKQHKGEILGCYEVMLASQTLWLQT